MNTNKHYRHLNLEDRVFIEQAVTENRSITWIAGELNVDATTVSRELKRNRRDDGYRKVRAYKNDCIHREKCTKHHLCGPDCTRFKCVVCKKGVMCSDICTDYVQDVCKRTTKAPWVCNGCDRRLTCSLRRYTYSAKLAQVLSTTRLVDSRTGLDLTGHEIIQIEEVVKRGLSLGQSIHHIFVTNPCLPCSERSFYRYVEDGSIGVASIELPKKIRYRKRKHSDPTHDRHYFDGHTYEDFLALDEDERRSVVEMDCVEGVVGDSSAILTLHFVALHFQIHMLLAKKDQAHVKQAIDWLEELCGKEQFKAIFGLILTDRGTEFSDIAGLEGTGRLRIYYTDPQRADQKGAAEKNHVELRKVIPKGTSLDELGLDAWIMAQISSHVNSSVRNSIGNATPMALAQVALPKSLLEGLGLELIPAREVELTPYLIERLKRQRDRITRRSL